MDTLAYLTELIAFPSTSDLSNLPITEHVQQHLERLGFETERLEYDDDAGVRKACVSGKLGSGLGGLAYFAHTDVVPADDWQLEHGPFQPTVKDQRLYGRGSCDMKGSLACMLAAVESSRQSDLRGPVYVTCTADEEIGYGGAREVVARSKLYREMIRGDSKGIIGEPTRLQVVYAHKGTYGFTAVSHGRAAHSSTREGVNANLAMIPFLVEMKRIHDQCEADPAWQNDEFDPPTVSWNIGINDHTRAVNITPPQSVCTVYFRPMPGQDADALVAQARAAAEQCGLEFRLNRSAGPLYIDPHSDMVREMIALTKNDQTSFQPTTVAYGTDGGIFSELQNMIVFGPGDIAQAHTADEWIALEQLEKGTTMFARLIDHWCGGAADG